MLNSEERRNYILNTLAKSTKPHSATSLARACEVSRQIIVGDIALMRASGTEIVATNRGYLLKKDDGVFRKTVKVRHDFSRLREELYSMVDGGTRVVDVVVDHKIYGSISASLDLSNRREVDEFVESFKNANDMSLSTITNHELYHTLEADSQEAIDYVLKKLKEEKFISE